MDHVSLRVEDGRRTVGIRTHRDPLRWGTAIEKTANGLGRGRGQGIDRRVGDDPRRDVDGAAGSGEGKGRPHELGVPVEMGRVEDADREAGSLDCLEHGIEARVLIPHMKVQHPLLAGQEGPHPNLAGVAGKV